MAFNPNPLKKSLLTPPWINKKSESNQTSWPLIHTTLNKSLPTPPLSQVPSKFQASHKIWVRSDNLSKIGKLKYSAHFLKLTNQTRSAPFLRLRNKHTFYTRCYICSFLEINIQNYNFSFLATSKQTYFLN